jgi:hypothetical protein
MSSMKNMALLGSWQSMRSQKCFIQGFQVASFSRGMRPVASTSVHSFVTVIGARVCQ